MADNDRNADSGKAAGEEMTVVTVPESHLKEVLDFVAGLDQEDSEVSGHMISGGALGSIGGGALAAKGGRSLTGCSNTGGTAYPDWQCSDLDR